MFRRIESIASAAVWSGYDGRTSTAPDFERGLSGKPTKSPFGLETI